MNTLEKIAAIGAALITLAALLMAFLAIKPDGLDERLAFATIVGLLMALVVLGLGRYRP